MLLIFLKRILIFTFILSSSSFVASEEAWIVEDIRISGLQRISAGSIFSNIPVTIGDKVDETDYKRVIKTLFDTGQFDDVQISIEGKIIFIGGSLTQGWAVDDSESFVWLLQEKRKDFNFRKYKVLF